ncbi:RNA 2',3'-cyclic phosphodiesterase [bacterium]|nr:RNA 2',3'-cyclic phosphodiesterase [bacterium]
MMRTFIALTLPELLKDRMLEVSGALSKTDAKIKWVERSQMHLTVKFCGDVEQAQADLLAAAVRDEATHWQHPLRLAVGGLGAFPNKRNPRVLWIGVRENIGLSSMAERIERAAVAAGIEPEQRTFSAHLTLGRVKFIDRHDPLPKRLKAMDVETYHYDITELALIRSQLTPQGPVYTPLEQVKLGG